MAGVLGEIAFGRLAVLLLAGREPLAVARRLRVGGIEALQDAERHVALRLRVGEPVIDPRAFRAARDEAGFGENLQMPRDARLRLAEDLRQLLHGALAALEQRQKPDARLVAGCLQLVDDKVDRKSHLLPANDMRISLYRYAGGVKAPRAGPTA